MSQTKAQLIDGKAAEIQFNTGSASTPTIAFTGDTNTGIYSPGADQLAISTNGTGRILIDSSGNLQIVTNSGSHGASSKTFSSAGTDGYYQKIRNEAFSHTWGIGASAYAVDGMTLDSSGRLGLGTSSAQTRLHVQDSIAGGSGGTVATLQNFSDTGADTRYAGLNFRIGSDNGTSAIRAYRTNSVTNYETNLSFWTNPAGATQDPVRAMTIDSYQRVGIGTTTVNRQLVLNDNGLACLALQNSTTGNNATDGFQIQLAGSDAYVWNYENAPLIFGANNAERLRVDSSGRLLVGTSTSRQVTIGESAGWDPRVQVTKTGTDGGNIAAYSWSTYNTSTGGGQGIGPDIVLARSNSNTEGTHVALAGAQLLGRITFNGSNGSAFAAGAYIAATADDAWASGDHPTRLVFSTTADGASSPTERMRIQNDGNISVGSGAATTYRLGLAVASGADKDVFLAGISGASNGFQVNWIHASTALSVKFNNITTTASAANAFLDSADGNRIYRSTSSLRYKKDVEDLDQLKADAVFSLRPVWYRSKVESDRSDWSWYGLIAEEVAKVEPRLVHWTYLDDAFDIEEVNGKIEKTLKPDAELVPDGVQYDRLTVLLLDVVKRQQQAIETLEAKVAALEAQ